MRDIRFNTIEEAITEIKRLENISKKTTGKWSYYQILDHCADGINSSIDGYSGSAPWLIRKTMGQIMKHKTFSQGYMDHGAVNPSAPNTREEGDEKKAQEKLFKAIDRFKNYTGKLQSHPFFEELSKEEFEKLHAFHIANHLCFVEIV
jgi:hypothetical protein